MATNTPSTATMATATFASTAMPTNTVRQLINMHPTNTVLDTMMFSESRKSWVHEYPPITKLRIHSYTQADGSVLADFDSAFLPLDNDDELRLNAPAFPPNVRHYRLYSEEDGTTWFNAEVSNIVLTGFQNFPLITQQAQHRPKRGSAVVDSAYTMNFGGHIPNLVIGEFKRNLIRPEQWTRNKLAGDQSAFSRELRGYASMYESPQVFAFDHKHLLILQFRAHNVDEIRTDGDVDCWILPRDNPGGTTWRYALYRLLVQGFRRAQGLYRVSPAFNGLYAEQVILYTGEPRWRINGHLTRNPFGYKRLFYSNTCAFYWADEEGNMLFDDTGMVILDSSPLWGV